MKVTAKCGNQHTTKIDPEFDELVCPTCGEPMEIEKSKSKKIILLVLAVILIGVFILWPRDAVKGGGSSSAYKISFKSSTNELYVKKSSTDNPNKFDYYQNGFAELSKFNFYIQDNLGGIYPIEKNQIRSTQKGTAGQLIICDEKVVGQIYVEGINDKYKNLGSKKEWNGKTLHLIKGGIVKGKTNKIDQEKNCFRLPIRLTEVTTNLRSSGILYVRLNDDLHKSDKRKFIYILNNSIVSERNRFELCKLKNRPNVSVVTVYEDGVDTSIQKPIQSNSISTTKEKCNCCMREKEVLQQKQRILKAFGGMEKNCSIRESIGPATNSLPKILWIEHPALKDISDTNIKSGKIQWSNFVTLCVLGKIDSVKLRPEGFVYTRCADGGSRLVGLRLTR